MSWLIWLESPSNGGAVRSIWESTMRNKAAISAIGTLAGLCLAGSAIAQQQQQTEDMEQQVSECREDLHALALQMQDDGYWLAGYPRTGTMGPAQFPGDQATTPVDPAAPTDPALADDVPAPEPHAGPVGPWGATGWQHQPQLEMRVLYQAALVLDRQGNDEACAQIVQTMAGTYQEQVEQLEELGVDPAEITAWRQSQIAEAQPVPEAFTHVEVENLIGMNVRSPEDRNLGDVGDILLDPETGAVDYVTVTRGGFFGIGEDEVAVPWEMFYVTADFTSLVLPADEATFEAAPQYQRRGMFDETTTGAIDRDELDAFWAEQQPVEQED
jgi:sporulation protein YlmC with PRC-barrel domain